MRRLLPSSSTFLFSLVVLVVGVGTSACGGSRSSTPPSKLATTTGANASTATETTSSTNSEPTPPPREGRWRNIGRIASGPEIYVGVSCASSSFCVAYDQTGDVSVYQGAQWSSLNRPFQGTERLHSLSCPSDGYCAGLLFSDKLTSTGGPISPVGIYEGGAWTELDPPLWDSYLSYLSCTSPSNCVAIGNNGQYEGIESILRGKQWSKGTQLHAL
jgi:hypothetical protein